MRLLLAVILAVAFAGAAAAQTDPQVAAGRAAFLAADYENAKRYLEPLAEAGDPEAQYWIGVMFAQGRGYPPVCRQAIRWYERAAAQGHPEATFNLAFMLYNGWGASGDGCTIRSNPARAAPWMEKAAALGVPRAQYLIGQMYRTGNGVPLSEDEAFVWLQKAAEAGLPEAQFDLGLMIAGASDAKEAYFWFFLLGLRGYPGAAQNADLLARQLTLPEIYEAGRRAHQRRLTEE